MPKEFKKRLEIFNKLFYKRCLFCEVMVEGESFKKTNSPTILPLCEFCLKRWEVVEELGKDKITNADQIREVRDCFKNSCYFCNDITIKRGFSQGSSRSQVFYKKILGEIETCEACYTRYDALCELEQEKQQEYQNQIQQPPKK